MNKNLNEQINWLDYKYQFVKRNKHWNYEPSYELKSNNNKIRLLFIFIYYYNKEKYY